MLTSDFCPLPPAILHSSFCVLSSILSTRHSGSAARADRNPNFRNMPVFAAFAFFLFFVFGFFRLTTGNCQLTTAPQAVARVGGFVFGSLRLNTAN